MKNKKTRTNQNKKLTTHKNDVYSQESIKDVVRSLFCIDERSIAAFRITLSLILLCDLIDRCRFMRAFHASTGVIPKHEFFTINSSFYWNNLIREFFPDNLYMIGFLFAIYFIFILLFSMNIFYRVSCFACWFLLNFIQFRMPLSLNAGDQILRLMMFWMFFMPLKNNLSKCSLQFTPFHHKKQIFCFCTAGLLIQVLSIYVFTAALKNGDVWRSEASALYYALHIEHFTTEIGLFMQNKITLLKLGTHIALILEVFGPAIIFFPIENQKIRLVAALIFMFFHLVTIGLLMDLGPITQISASLWILFLPSIFWDYINKRFPNLKLDLNNFKLISKLKSFEIRTFRPSKSYLENIISNIIPGFFIIYILWYNISSLDHSRYFNTFPKALIPIGQITNVNQKWAMFAPSPPTGSSWYVVQVETDNKKVFDALTGKPVTWEKPRPIYKMYVNERWRRYLMNLENNEYHIHRAYYCRYLHDWYHRAGIKVRRISIECMVESTPRPGRPKLPAKKVHLCDFEWNTPKTKPSK